MSIDWEGMPHGVLVEELRSGIAERDKRVRALEALTVQRGRPKAGNGFAAPQGDLDRDAAGDA